ncbi:branched-chain amino acid transport system ATP-binding protein [Chromobacterium alkanivorans]|uniref:ABC transporter ATP-binding protein n=1 Tax=Chromobacterium alkanivorans TaxID=1071719 RepID=UPI0021674A6B|nr:ABC transporter ATP-binding protein [Chromobacterium alkanivorans]MCS3806596.1 branched-chain amino acid transport system ATP-binding protein [Chromobacterium alkanivorans]MCS3820934.1 branched-chain amino acid transport system ATP-binding protein [Chromobacterium alkanivorans]MCS3875856.1 branched-chain amino acid transport system ATP-binding protein [Chromobacterium alkanivorans]
MLKLEDISVRFGGLAALKGVSLEIGDDEIVGLVGPNGAGKTTLFNTISGLVRPSGGRILFQSRDILSLPLYQRARLGIGRSFQIPQPMHLLTVRENLQVAQRFGAGQRDPEDIERILDLLALNAKAERQAAGELSQSELKALEVGKALATRPKILLLDEVLAGLETSSKRRFMTMLQGLQQRYALTILLIEHDIETIHRLCRRVCVLDFGELIADGEPDAVFRDPRVVSSYTGENHA